ncbi:type VII toxin-antitoxin system MntA family adenylyltransferase antitoxin [Desulfonatronum lacustre]|uniref:type VII toxin-antitoxin system MntA family adenylyltransferase antitoxin n=1 Tax=Desulfonatronum lacustre TaxID=66849 RepID=UPI0004AF0919|nr:nucleotidyltransferase domain-containing protein [Desulfonatronum lacustre]
MTGQLHHQGKRTGNLYFPKSADLAALLQPVLSRESTIIAAYLFGSAARGQMRVGSDIDVAVILDSLGPKMDRKQLFDRLLPRLCRAVRHDVHLVVLNDASYLLRVQVVHDGNLIHVANREKMARFQMVSTVLYADFSPILEMTRSGLRQKLRERTRA